MPQVHIKAIIVASVLALSVSVAQARLLTCHEEYEKVQRVLETSKITSEAMVTIEAQIFEALAFKENGDDLRCGIIMREIFPTQ